jgi:nucleoside-diphosphate-sugar epimerase
MISLENRRIALIGGAGFIGHNLALALKARGAQVSVIDGLEVNNLLHYTTNAPFPDRRNLYLNMINARLDMLREADVPIHVLDARNFYALRDVLREIRPHAVVQLAAVAHAARSNKEPRGSFEHSMSTLEHALECSREGVEHFVYFSSSMVYGNFADGYVTETTPCEPLGIYGALKLGGEKLVIAYNQVFGFPHTIVRPSALYGERCVSRRVGQLFIESAMQGKDLVVHGDGSEALDFTYVLDLVQGLVRVLENDASHNQIFNLTYGQGRSVADLASLVRAHFPGVGVRFEPKDRLTPERGTLVIDKAKSLLGYNPEYPIEKGFVRYIEWYKRFWA